MHDNHAARVLPGYDPNTKITLLQQLKDDMDIIICINAQDIERRKMRSDFGITYDDAALKLIDDLQEEGLKTTAVVISKYEEHKVIDQFEHILKSHNIPVYRHGLIKGYPDDIEYVISDKGYGSNPYIETTKKIVVVTGPGPGSGKMATCLSQIYHDQKKGLEAGYAKFETFPVWNLPLKHPINLAYEAATADLSDFNQIDPYHLEAYNITATSYNRDVQAFPILKRILSKLITRDPYKSPTDMGVNRVGFAITDPDMIEEAARQEIIRRYFKYSCELEVGTTKRDTVERVKMLMNGLNLSINDRPVVTPAREAAARAKELDRGHDDIYSGAAIQLADGTIITGMNSVLLHASSALILNAIKYLAGIPQKIDLITPNVIESIGHLKKALGQSGVPSLSLEECLIALSVSAINNTVAGMALETLKELEGCEVHLTHIPPPGDESGLRRLGVNFTSDPIFSSSNLFNK
jgi:uncharacterized protein (UPF0371 family)